MLHKFIYVFFVVLFIGCIDDTRVTKPVQCYPDIFPDYANVTVPLNIAPLNFSLKSGNLKGKAVFSSDNYSFDVETDDGCFQIPFKKWKELLSKAAGHYLNVTVSECKGKYWLVYKPFRINVAKEPIDKFIVYRLIDPGYELWNQMGIYQRNLETYSESAVIENKTTEQNCINCHSFCMQNPDKMLFHIRGALGCTILIDGDKITKLDTKTDATLSALVYPSWHPSGKYVAFSVNKTIQGFHPTQRVEVTDEASDVVVYDVAKKEIVTAPCLFSKNALETFPTFSPDGRTLYYCTANYGAATDDVKKIKYSLCRISFDPETRSFGSVADTLYNASAEMKSVSFPRISPDGKFLLCTVSEYGTFSIWHKDADLCLIDLIKGEKRMLDEANGPDTDSYHSWSSNSRWIVFSSRRLDGLYTRPFISYMNSQGKAGKPFLLPQKRPAEFYGNLMKSYNIPELVKGKVNKDSYEMASLIKKGKSESITFGKK